MILRSSLRAVACIAAACGTSFAAHAAPSYHLVDLGVDSAVGDINNHGAIAGYTAGAGVIWRDGVSLPRPQSTGFNDIDDQGELVGGELTADGKSVPAYWPHGGGPIQIVTAFTPKRTNPIAVASGRVAGYGYASDNVAHCFAWTPAGGAVEFGDDDGVGGCIPTGINDAGQVTGAMTPVGALQAQAFIWQDGVMSFLGTLPGGTASYGMAINRKGHVAATADRLLANGSMGQHAALWNGSRLVDLGVVYKSGVTQASALNDQDDVVGQAFDHRGVNRTLFLYTGGQMFDLVSLVDNLGGWQLSTPPRGIADDGTVVGTTDVVGVMHAYMLVPAAPLH